MSGPCKPSVYRNTAPLDREADATYERLLKQAEAAGLIVQAFGGVATLAIPSEQRKAGIRQQTLDAAMLNETGRTT
jgi:hypothetical protein